MTALKSPSLENRPAVRSTGAVAKTVDARPASFLGLIGSFRHKITSLLRRIIGVTKICVKVTDMWVTPGWSDP